MSFISFAKCSAIVCSNIASYLILTSPEIIDVTSTDISVSKANLMATPNFKGQGGIVLSRVQKEELRNLVKSPKNIPVGPLCRQYSFPLFPHV